MFFEIIAFSNFKSDYNYQTYEIEDLSDTPINKNKVTHKNTKQEFLQELKIKIKEIQDKRKTD